MVKISKENSKQGIKMKTKFIGSIIAASLLTTSIYAKEEKVSDIELLKNEIANLKEEMKLMKDGNKSSVSNKSIATEDEENTKVKSKALANEDDEEKFDAQKEIANIKDEMLGITKKVNGNNLKWDTDLRTSYDNIQYKMADGSKASNNAMFTNRLWLGMSYAANENLTFHGQLSYKKLYGQRSLSSYDLANLEGFDWIASESASDDKVRVRNAYFLYSKEDFFGIKMPWTFSLGRRHSTEGGLINLRDDEHPASPLGHTINVEFDGLSSKFGLEQLTGLPNSYFKLCAGRGMSNAQPSLGYAPYVSTTGNTDNIDLGGIIFVPYDDKQYSVGMQYTYANNLIDLKDRTIISNGMETVGGIHTGTAYFQVNGIGDRINDYLDNTLVFVSGAFTKTNPYTGHNMLGSTDSKVGTSFWIGTQMPSLISEEGKWGVEYNHGSKYWRPFTYGEDTASGSKIATRGNAYEIYFTEPIAEKMSIQLRYTLEKYDYTGSNGFFGGQTGTPMTLSDADAAGMGSQSVKTGQDIRVYLRYRF